MTGTLPTPSPIEPIENRNLFHMVPSGRFWHIIGQSLLWILPIGVGICWSIYPAITGYLAAEEFKKSPVALQIKQNQWGDAVERKVQKFFLDHNIYIPMEDIIINRENHISEKSPLFQMRKSCGQGKLYVWIPLRVRIPLFGEKVIEWCLKQP